MTPIHRSRSVVTGPRRASRPAALLLVAMLCQPRVALAEVPADARAHADELFEEGKAALLGGDWTRGCELFLQSQKLDPSASTLVKLARCHEQEGRIVAALGAYDEALALLRLRPENDEHARELGALVGTAQRTLEPRVGWLRLRLSPSVPQFSLRIDGQPMAAFDPATPVMLDPGAHDIDVTAPGDQAAQVHLTLAEGETRELVVELKAEPVRPPVTTMPSSPVAPARPPPFAAPPRASGRDPDKSATSVGHQVLALTLMGSGGVLLGTAGYFGIRTYALVRDARQDGHCDSDFRCDEHGLSLLNQARKSQAVGLVLGAGGAVVAAAGVVLWATAPSDRSPRSRPRVAVRMFPTGVSLGGAF